MRLHFGKGENKMEIQTEKMELLSSIIIFMSNIIMMVTAIQEK